MSDNQGRNGGYRGIIAAVAAVVLLIAGGVIIRGGGTARRAPQGPGADQARPAAAPAAPDDAATPSVATSPSAKGKTSRAASKFGPILPRSAPVRLSIPSIGVDTKGIIELGLQPNREMEVPKDFGQVGWFAPGPAPGQFGPAVLAGHVDSRAGPAVFWKLGRVRRGDAVQVDRQDDTTATFVVDGVERYPKDEFPTVKVYSNTTDRSELRLITCGGTFDSTTGHYRDNVVVYAHQV